MEYLLFGLSLVFAILTFALLWPREKACRCCQGRGWVILTGEHPRLRKTVTCPRCEGRRTEE